MCETVFTIPRAAFSLNIVFLSSFLVEIPRSSAAGCEGPTSVTANRVLYWGRGQLDNPLASPSPHSFSSGRWTVLPDGKGAVWKETPSSSGVLITVTLQNHSGSSHGSETICSSPWPLRTLKIYVQSVFSAIIAELDELPVIPWTHTDLSPLCPLLLD